MEKVLSDVYYDLENSAGFSSVQKLYAAAKTKFPGLKYTDVADWLKSQNTYTLHRPKRKNFLRNHTIASTVDELWQADLVDMQEFKKDNRNNGYILTVVDVLSKYAFAVPVKTKHGDIVANAFRSLFDKRKPCYLQTDQGKEFLNAQVKGVMKEYGVCHYTTKDADVKCSVVERFNRTLRGKMFRYFTHIGKHAYLDVLEKLVGSYNRTVHRVTRMKPCDVTHEDETVLFKRLYGFETKRDMMLQARNITRKVLSVGAKVRIKYKEELMDKGYYPSWTDEIFTVQKVIKDTYNKPMYTLCDHTGEIIEGRFYPEEVQQIKEDAFRIEVLRKRTRRGVREVLVHWIGYPSSDD